ncbi:MAG: hypothetical protein WBA41_07685 [Rivularia sp. (in: cyanobacteria)]
MKKILGIFVASVAVIGSAIFAAPAQAQNSETIDVQVTVDPVLYLQTFETVNLRISQEDLGAGAQSSKMGIQTGQTSIEEILDDTLVPGAGNKTDYTTQSMDLYAVLGNSSTPVNVTVRVDDTEGTDGTTGEKLTNTDENGNVASAIMTIANGATFDSIIPEGESMVTGQVQLTFDFFRQQTTSTGSVDIEAVPRAGLYTGGKLIVEAQSGI